MTNEQIKSILLSRGNFKLKEQKDGSLDLSPYVCDDIQAVIKSIDTIYELRFETNDVYYVLMRALDKSIIDAKVAEIRAFDKETIETGREVDYYDHPISKFDGHWMEDDYQDFYLTDLNEETWASQLEIVSEKIWR